MYLNILDTFNNLFLKIENSFLRLYLFSALYCFYCISMIFIILQNCLNFTYLQMMQTSFMPLSILFLIQVTSVHNYNTRFAAKHSYYLPYAKTNYGKFGKGKESDPTDASVDTSANASVDNWPTVG